MKKYHFKDIWIVLLGMIFVASTLRAPLTSVGPVVDSIKSTLEINNTFTYIRDCISVSIESCY